MEWSSGLIRRSRVLSDANRPCLTVTGTASGFAGNASDLARNHAIIKMPPGEVLFGHRIRLPVAAEASSREVEEWRSAAVASPPEADKHEQLSMQRVHQFREVERVALRNIDTSNLRIAAAERPAKAQSGAETPSWEI